MASRAPMSSSKVDRSCSMQSNLKMISSSGSDVVFFMSLRMRAFVCAISSLFTSTAAAISALMLPLVVVLVLVVVSGVVADK